MGKKWDIKSVEYHYYPEETKSQRQSLDQLTDILYSYFSQLEAKSNQAKATVAVSNPNQEEA